MPETSVYYGSPSVAAPWTALSRMLAGSHTVPLALVRTGKILFANPAFAELFGRSTVEGARLPDLFAPQAGAALADQLARVGSSLRAWQGRADRPDLAIVDVELHFTPELLDGAPALCVFAKDVSDRRLAELHLNSLAFCGSLIGLPNRALLLDALQAALSAARQAGDQATAVLMVDVDGLERVNDTLGHHAGDLLLQLVAQRFRDCIRAGDTLAKLGGDEFGIVLSKIAERDAAERVGEGVVRAAREPLPVGERLVTLSASVGIAVTQAGRASPDGLMAAADAALYRAKNTGRGRVVFAEGEPVEADVVIPLIAWSTAHEIGIPEIDAQHRRLAGQINELADLLKSGVPGHEVMAQLDATLAYAAHHFASEEALMERHNAPGLADHRAWHALLLSDLRRFSLATDCRSLSLTTRFLQEWLLRHIDTADREFAAHLRTAGASGSDSGCAQGDEHAAARRGEQLGAAAKLFVPVTRYARDRHRKMVRN